MNDQPSPPAPGSAPDGYDQRLKEWCEKRGVHHGDLHRQETFLDDSDEDEEWEGEDDGPISLCEDFDEDGVHVELYDLYGWRERFKVADLRAHCAKHGKIRTWKDFQKLADVPSEDVGSRTSRITGEKRPVHRQFSGFDTLEFRMSKSPFSSLTLIGLLISVLGKAFGVDVSEHEQQTILDSVKELWPIVAGLLADCAAAYHRFNASRFNKTAFQSPVFWYTVLSAFLTIVAAFGLDVTGFQDVLTKSMNAVPAVIALAGALIALVGRARATKRLG